MVSSFSELPLLMTPKQLAEATGEHVNSIRRSIAAGRIRRTRWTGGSISAVTWCSRTRRKGWLLMVKTRDPAERAGRGAGAIAAAFGPGRAAGYGPEGAAGAVAAALAAVKFLAGFFGDTV